ncbi:hypothetical protein M3Y98_00577600 [Aphelenchoides besseyi]|nr:hypothetical protein M3Y98_00577600 [Aphelenchoides besseyi]KAI6193852.1 hypothetical protein M3Y96_01062700 [Aphelenchoides besseyi]
MDCNIKKELIEEINQLAIKQEHLLDMPSRITSAILEIPPAYTVDVQVEAVEISGANKVPIDDFEHGPVKQYSTQIIYSRNKVILHDVRRKGLNEDAEEMELARNDLVLTSNDADEFVNFVTDLKAADYSERPTQCDPVVNC